MEKRQSMHSPILGNHVLHENYNYNNKKKKYCNKALWLSLALIIIVVLGAVYGGDFSWGLRGESRLNEKLKDNRPDIVKSEYGVVAADDEQCSEVGVAMLRQGGHAVDAAVATALCLGVVHPMSSGIGGGSFMVVQSSSTLKTQAFDARETAPLDASQDMYADNTKAKYKGPLSIGVPGELAGLHEAWLQYGRLAWRTLFQPAIKLAKEGFIIAPCLNKYISKNREKIMGDPGLKQVYAPDGNLLQTGDICSNVELARSLEAVATDGPEAFYNGTIGENLVKDVRKAGGIITMEDLNSYKVKISDAMAVNAMGYTIYGMHPPSSGTPGLALVLNILNGYESPDAAKGSLGLHRLIEALKHMFSIRMDLGDPDFVDTSDTLVKMLSPSYAEKIRQQVLDNITFPPEYYMYRWSQLRDQGTSHFCIVDANRNVVSMTTTVNYAFGAGVLSPSTGILLNNEMGDFSIPTELSPDKLPPAPANFIRPNKKPLSSMTPLIITKDNKLVGVIGGSGGLKIIPAVIQVFLNHFVMGMDPLLAIQSPRVYHQLIPNVIQYENWTVYDGNHIELPYERQSFLKERGHQLEATTSGAIVQLVVQTFENTEAETGRKLGNDSTAQTVYGTLTAVCDPRKNGKPAAV